MENFEFADYEKQANKQKEKKKGKTVKNIKKRINASHFQYDFFSSIGSIDTRSTKLDKYKI